MRYLIFQGLAIAMGVMAFAVISSLDMEVLSEYRSIMVLFNTFLLLMLIPFGTDNNTGNRSWLDFPLLPINIQPAEICKITYVIIMASVMSSHQNRISHPASVIHMVTHLGMLVGLNMVLSSDLGVSLIFKENNLHLFQCCAVECGDKLGKSLPLEGGAQTLDVGTERNVHLAANHACINIGLDRVGKHQIGTLGTELVVYHY